MDNLTNCDIDLSSFIKMIISGETALVSTEALKCLMNRALNLIENNNRYNNTKNTTVIDICTVKKNEKINLLFKPSSSSKYKADLIINAHEFDNEDKIVEYIKGQYTIKLLPYMINMEHNNYMIYSKSSTVLSLRSIKKQDDCYYFEAFENITDKKTNYTIVSQNTDNVMYLTFMMNINDNEKIKKVENRKVVISTTIQDYANCIASIKNKVIESRGSGGNGIFPKNTKLSDKLIDNFIIPDDDDKYYIDEIYIDSTLKFNIMQTTSIFNNTNFITLPKNTFFDIKDKDNNLLYLGAWINQKQ